MHGKLLCAALALHVLGCNDPSPTAARPRGIAPGEEKTAPPAAPAPPPPTSPTLANRPSALASPFASADPGAMMRPAADAGQGSGNDAGAVDAGPPRDLAGELLERVGQPASCLDLTQAAQNGGRLNVVVVAEVMPSGRITRAQVSAPNQPASALRCIENKVTSAGLKGPVPGAPRSVTATLPLEVASQPTPR